ncbi:hypothetical protein [Macromonas nakdongensis]|uniref:hypothetical protein n=1 Tax=Macromonas nakdongensis TaxID=1843082 RepID=UPI000C326E2D|nr:hypothetical protein [Macromonas nakdongensis]
MRGSYGFGPLRPWLLGLLCWPVLGWAQATGADAARAWREANDAVGQFPRGHADVLKWERAQAPQTGGVATAQSPAGLALATAEAAVRQAWHAHRDLQRPLARLGAQNVDRIAQGRWLELEPGVIRRVEDFDEVVEVAVQARKAWTEAVASRQAVQHLRAAQEAAHAASELGRRMVQVGNWSALQNTPAQLALATAQTDLRRAQVAATQAQARLLKVLQLAGLHAVAALPDQLPEPPSGTLSEAEFQQRQARIQAQLPRASALAHQALAPVAFEAYQGAHAIARSARDDVLNLKTFVTDETVLHYNGMLKSTWELLGAAQSQSLAVASAIAAQRDFEIAQIDLHWLLLGGLPDPLVSLGGGAAEAASPAAH